MHQPPAWATLDALREGNARQRRAYRSLEALQILARLRAYDATLVGTIPLNIDTPKSDLDIVCHVRAMPVFRQRVRHFWGKQAHYHETQKHKTLVISWRWQGWHIEIYAENCPVYQQNAYVHMLVEQRLLMLGGEPLRQHIQHIKRCGIKTEPAFMHVLGLEHQSWDDAYVALYRLATYDDRELENIIRHTINRTTNQGEAHTS
jgi:hypothetical protein